MVVRWFDSNGRHSISSVPTKGNTMSVTLTKSSDLRAISDEIESKIMHRAITMNDYITAQAKLYFDALSILDNDWFVEDEVATKIGTEIIDWAESLDDESDENDPSVLTFITTWTPGVSWEEYRDILSWNN